MVMTTSCAGVICGAAGFSPPAADGGLKPAAPRSSTAFEYGHCLIHDFWRSIVFASCASIGKPSAIWIAGASTSFSESLPYSASITINPPGVPGVTAASGPYSGG
jgi:hypothetical protein